MILDDYRETAEPIFSAMARWLADYHPNTMTWVAFIFGVSAGLSFYGTNFFGDNGKLFLLLASIFILLNGLFDAIDGKIARLRKMETKMGDFLDHVLDRYADVFIIGGITVSAYCDAKIGLLAILGVIFASYMGTQAQAVGLKREYKGLLGRADRLFLLILVPLIQFILISVKVNGTITPRMISLVPYGISYELTLIEILMIWFAIAGHATAIQRAWKTWNELKKMG